MIRKPSLSIDQVERLERSNAPLQEEQVEKEDKRKAPKEFLIGRNSYGLHTVKLSAGGEVPALLRGSYTSTTKAQDAINDYLRHRAASDN